ncbi:MAG TPA: hypothetical protein VD886_20345 [Herpetosiphonaceae bacterium]|nr:hypothetical protein [Herpetosiphonaceae bacterium]
MSVLLQDFSGVIDAVAGRVCERLLGVYVRYDDGRLNPGVFWMKVVDGPWHRFFIDLSIGYLRWNAEPEPYKSDLDDPDDYPVIDLGLRHNLHGLSIRSAVMEQLGAGPQSQGCLTICFAGSRVFRLIAGGDLTALSIT